MELQYLARLGLPALSRKKNVLKSHIINKSFINHACLVKIYMLLTGWEVRIGKNCDRGLENAAQGHRPRAAFSSPRSQFFPIRTDPKPANNIFIFFFLP